MSKIDLPTGSDAEGDAEVIIRDTLGVAVPDQPPAKRKWYMDPFVVRIATGLIFGGALWLIFG